MKRTKTFLHQLFVFPIGVPGINIPSFPDAKTFISSISFHNPLVNILKLGLFVPLLINSLSSFSSKVNGILLLRSFKSKTLDDK